MFKNSENKKVGDLVTIVSSNQKALIIDIDARGKVKKLLYLASSITEEFDSLAPWLIKDPDEEHLCLFNRRIFSFIGDVHPYKQSLNLKIKSHGGSIKPLSLKTTDVISSWPELKVYNSVKNWGADEIWDWIIEATRK